MIKGIDECVQKAKQSQRLSLAIIGSTAKYNNPPFLIGPARESKQFVACYFIISDKRYVKEICEYADGKVDYIFIDTEAKTEAAADFLSVAKSCVFKSEVKTYKGNDITALACDILINELAGDLKGKKVSIIGAGNLGSKLALTFAERGANVHITRRDLKGPLIASVLNFIKPRYTIGAVYSEGDLSLSANNADVLIGFTQGYPVIDENMISSLAGNALIIDGGIGTVKEEAITKAKQLGMTLIRLDVRIAFSYVIDAILDMEFFIKNIAGTTSIDGKNYVAGGIIGEKNDIVLYDIRNPSEIIGIADGKGGIQQ